jgi:hypothetical protein
MSASCTRVASRRGTTPKSARKTLEEHHAQISLEIVDLAREWRVRDAETRRGACERALLRDRDEIAKMPKLHVSCAATVADRHW